MNKVFGTWPKKSIFKLILMASSLIFLFACARVQPVQQSSPTVEPTVEEVKKETVQDRPVSPEPPPVKTTPTPIPAPVPPSEPQRTTKPPPPPAPTPPPSRTTKVIWDSVNLREGPGMNHKVIGSIKKGTSLTVLEVKGSWLHVRLEDGKEAWVIRSATSEAPAPTPPSPTPKPKPM